MTDRKSFLRTDRLAQGKSCFAESEWQKVVLHFPEKHDHAALRIKLDQIAGHYCVALAMEPTTGPTVAAEIKLYSELAAVTDRLGNLLAGLKGIDFFRPMIEPRLGLDRYLAREGVVLEAGASLETDLETFRETLTFLQRSSADIAAILSEPQSRQRYSPKDAVVAFILDYWTSDLGRKIPKSCAGGVADFVIAASNPILRLGGQQVASAGSARALIKELSTGRAV